MPSNQYPSHNFLTTLENASQKLRKIGQGKEIGKDYERIKDKLIIYADSPNEKIMFDNQADIRRALSVLIQEVSNKNDVLKLLIEKSKLNSLFNNISKQLKDDYKNIIAKKMLSLYYSRYFNFEYLSEKEGFYFYQLLTHLINNFDGKSMILLKAKENQYILSGDLHGAIKKYKELKTIGQELSLLESFEIYQCIKILFLIEKAKEWRVNQWDKDVECVLEQILQHKNIMVEQRNLLEETVFIILEKCKSVDKIIDNWLNFIFKNIGDPRILRHQNVWFRIGEEYYYWLRAKLSQDDVRAFLENMTDGQGDEVYQYRRQFWLQYIKHIQYSKIIMSGSGLNYLKDNNPEMYKKFQSYPESYSKFHKQTQRSCIFMDFGSFYVIEGTHNAKLRFYKDIPINLSKRNYDYKEFHSGEADNALLEDFTHYNSESYYWQNQVRCFIMDNFNIHVKLDGIILKEDKYRLQLIKDHLFERNQSIL